MKRTVNESPSDLFELLTEEKKERAAKGWEASLHPSSWR